MGAEVEILYPAAAKAPITVGVPSPHLYVQQHLRVCPPRQYLHHHKQSSFPAQELFQLHKVFLFKFHFKNATYF